MKFIAYILFISLPFSMKGSDILSTEKSIVSAAKPFQKPAKETDEN